MKKTVAVITLILSLLIISGVVAVLSDKSPNGPEQINTAVQLYKSLVQPNLQRPIAWGACAFWLLSFTLSLSVLFMGDTSLSAQITAEQDEKIASLKAKLAQAESDLATAKDKTSQAEAETAKLEAENQNKLKEIEEANKRLSAAEAEFKSKLCAEAEQTRLVQNDLNSAKQAHKSLENELLSERSKLEALERDSKSIKIEKNKAESALKSADKAIKTREAELIQVKKEINDLKEKLNSLEADQKGGSGAIAPAAYQILYLFQKEGRLIDLLKEDISQFSDETLGGALRPIHEGCKKLLETRLIVEPVLNEEEGSVVTVDEANAESIKLSGNVPPNGPFTGELIHRGWQLKECRLPELVNGWKGNVIAPAEIEIG